MKAVWIALMLGSMGGWIALLSIGVDRYSAHGLNLWSVIFWVLSAVVIGIGVYAFHRASKLGKEEDEIRRRKDSDFYNIG